MASVLFVDLLLRSILKGAGRIRPWCYKRWLRLNEGSFRISGIVSPHFVLSVVITEFGSCLSVLVL